MLFDWFEALIAGLGRPHTASPAQRCPQGRRAALGASTGVAGGGAAAPPPVAVRRCRLVQPTRKLTTAAFAGVDPATYYAGVDLFGPYVTMERVAILACAGIATQLFLEARPDGLYVDAQFAACRSPCGFVERVNCIRPYNLGLCATGRDWGLEQSPHQLSPTYLLPPSLRCCPCDPFLQKNKVSNDKQEEGKLKAENEALRTRLDDAEAAVSSLLARVDGLEAEHAALRGLPSSEA